MISAPVIESGANWVKTGAMLTNKRSKCGVLALCILPRSPALDTKSGHNDGYKKWKKPLAKYTMPTAPTIDAMSQMDFFLISAAMEQRRIPI